LGKHHIFVKVPPSAVKGLRHLKRKSGKKKYGSHPLPTNRATIAYQKKKPEGGGNFKHASSDCRNTQNRKISGGGEGGIDNRETHQKLKMIYKKGGLTWVNLELEQKTTL